jgi:triosephosphate isomerase (TIM)
MERTPIIVVNVKTYLESTGPKAVAMAKLMNMLAKETKASLAIAVQPSDLAACVAQGPMPVYAQHIDPMPPGSNTGWILPEAVKAVGAVGTLINHSEHRLKLADIDACITRARMTGLTSIVCTNNVATSRAAAGLGPVMVAVEPPELIGGDISVTSADPRIVSDTVAAVKKIDPQVKILCGAGVKTGEDVAAARRLGADGVLLASGVVKAKNQDAVLRDLIAGLQ